MALLNKQAYGYTVSTTKEELRKFIPIFTAYNTEADIADNTIYLGDYATTGAIAGGTIQRLSSPTPQSVNKYGRPFQYGSTINRPLTDRTGGLVQRVTSTGVASGREWVTGIKLVSVDLNDFLGVVLKTSVTSGTVSIRFGSDSTNYYTYTITLDATSTVYDLKTFRIGAGTATGTPVLTAMDYFAVIGSAAMDIDVFQYATANNPTNFIGATYTLPFDCLVDQTFESTLDTGEIMCFNYVEQVVATKKSFKITVKQNQGMMKTMAAALGTGLKRGLTNTRDVLNSETEGARAAISAGTITLATGLSISRFARVSVDGIALDRVYSASEVTETTYFYNSTTGVMTFSTVYNTLIPTVEYVFATDANYFDNQNLKTGLVGNLMMQRQLVGGTTQVYEFFVAQLTDYKPSATDTNVEYEATFDCFPLTVGTNRRFFTYSEK
jgi:hypothetical protein